MKSGRVGDAGFRMESGIFHKLLPGRRKYRRRLVLANIFAIALMSGVCSAWAVDAQTNGAAANEPPSAPAVVASGAFKAGDIAATAFGGSKLIVDSLTPGVDPVSKTFLDPDGIVLRVFSLPNRGDPKTEQILSPPAVYQVQARDIGHLFGLAFDNLAANGSATPG